MNASQITIIDSWENLFVCDIRCSWQIGLKFAIKHGIIKRDFATFEFIMNWESGISYITTALVYVFYIATISSLHSIQCGKGAGEKSREVIESAPQLLHVY